MSHTQPVITTVSDNGKVGVDLPDSEVVSKPRRRRFSNGYKLRILDEAAPCADGEVGALLRREGLYSSHLTTWRQQRERGELQHPSAKKRGRQPEPQAAELVRLRQENERLRVRLQQAETILDVQKKLSQMFGPTPTLSAEAK
jgi:transposase-like protein